MPRVSVSSLILALSPLCLTSACPAPGGPSPYGSAPECTRWADSDLTQLRQEPTYASTGSASPVTARKLAAITSATSTADASSTAADSDADSDAGSNAGSNAKPGSPRAGSRRTNHNNGAVPMAS